jgi:PAS domain S-box-containing protein
MPGLLLDANLRLSITDRLTVVSASEEVAALLGFTAEALEGGGVPLRERIHAADLEAMEALLSPKNRRRSGGFQLRIRHADGRMRVGRGQYQKEKAAAGGKLTLEFESGTGADGHGRRGKAGEGAPLAAQLRALLEYSDDVLVFKGLDHRIRAAGQKLRGFCDWKGEAEELVGRTDYDLFPEEFADLNYQLEAEVLGGNPGARRIVRSPRPGDGERWVEIAKYPVLGENGKLVGVLGITREVAASQSTGAEAVGAESGGAAGQNHPGAHAHGNDPPESLERITQGFRDQEFMMYYQPKVNMSTGKVVGAEALIRWQHPERGMLSPGKFLPAIEGKPLALELGEWVIETALTQMESWLDLGLDIPVSVNVGPDHLQREDFVGRLARLMSKHPRIKPCNLELEIVESSAPKDVGKLTDLLTGCQQIGVSFALDDFGNGHSSLNYLKNLPAGVLKIDPSFVRDIMEKPEDLSILEGVLGLAAAFSRKSIAEGVENVDQGLTLLRLGCELAQGYGIARPMPADEFPHWAATWKPDPRWSEALTESVDERTLLYTTVEHRAWIAGIEAFLKGESHVQPLLGRHQCQFGAWLDQESQAGRNTQPEMQALVAMHWRMHALATGILKFQAQGKSAEGLARMDELKGLLEKMIEQLKGLRHRT